MSEPMKPTSEILKEYNERFGFLDKIVERHCIPNATEENGNAWNYGELIRAFFVKAIDTERSAVAALEQKLLASEVRGGELREVLEYVYHAIRSHSSVVVSCRGAVGTMNEHEHHLQRGIDEIRKVLAKGTAHYSSQVEAIGKMVEALEYISKYDLYKHGLKDGQLNIEHHINVMASDALTTWNSIKGETEGA